MRPSKFPVDSTALVGLYNSTSKHSSYQVLARSLQNIVQLSGLNIVSRYEFERMDYIVSHCSFDRKNVADIGGNTGFFTFESVTNGAFSVFYFEGNAAHVEFVSAAVSALDLDAVVTVAEKYVNFVDNFYDVVDVCFLLNVLHHVGDDYGDPTITCDRARSEIIESLSYMSRRARILILQIGFNWKGNRNSPLFESGTKREMIDFVEKYAARDWEILSIGVAVKLEGLVKYEDFGGANMERDDTIGEFLNRPVFIMRSKWL